MKRSRDDGDGDDDDGVLVDSEHKRPAISPRVQQPGQVVQMSNSGNAQKLTTEDALSYLKHVKEYFEAEKNNKYGIFLNIMKDFKAQRIDTDGVILRVKGLFKDNRDLILGFNRFLPRGHEIKLSLKDEPITKKGPITFKDAVGFVKKIKGRFNNNVYTDFLDILNKFRQNIKGSNEVYEEVSILFQGHADLLVDFIHFLPGISGTVSAYYVQSLSNHTTNGDGKVSPEWRTHVEKSNHFEKNDWEEDDGIGRKRKARRDDSETDHVRREMKNIEISFRGKMKDRLQDPEVAGKFSDCIRAFRSMFFTADEFRNLIYSLLGAHSDVVEACEDFLSYIETNGSLRNNRQVFGNLKIDGDRDNDDTKDREKNKVHNIRERDRHDRGLSSNAKDVLGLRIPCASKEKFFAKPIHELDLSNCKEGTPSYRQLPENYPIPSTRGRTEIGNQVLNDRWVSVTSGSEDYSFKHTRKNQYEENLFRCEDDRFELDMLLESVKSTAKRVEELIYSMNARAIMTESSFCIEDHLTALNLRCIERLYGDHGLDVMDVLRKNAPVALPVILTRLKQKQGEWDRCRVDFNKVWAEIYAKNYHKSLDHRSFYFKQQDTKNLTTKGMLAYIENLFVSDQTEDELLLSFYSGHSFSVRTHMEVKYIDPDVHEDVLQIIKYLCAEICTPEQSDQILKTWSTFIEPMLGIPSRGILCNAPQSTEGEKNIDDGNASGILKCNSQASSCCGTEAMPNQESEGGGVAANLSSLAIGTVPKEVKVPDSIRLTVKPLNVKVPMELQDKDRTSRVFYGNNSFYFLFRLHQLLYERMLSAKLASENRWNVSNDANPTDLYARFKDALCSFLNGSIDNSKFEDECRAILGFQSFTLFTLDKLIHKLVKQIQRIVTEPLYTKLLELFDYERSRSTKTFTDATYRVNARFLLQRENMYRIEFFPSPTRMTIQLIKYDEEYDEFDPLSVSNYPYFDAYVNDELLCVCPGKEKQPAVFLKRNKKIYTTGDEDADFCKTMDEVLMHNGLIMRFISETNKAAYVMGTEDLLFHPKKRRVLNGSVPPNVRLHRDKQRKALMLGELGGEKIEQPQLDPEVD